MDGMNLRQNLEKKKKTGRKPQRQLAEAFQAEETASVNVMGVGGFEAEQKGQVAAGGRSCG